MPERPLDGAGYIQTVGFGFPDNPETPVVFVTAGVAKGEIDDPLATLTEVDASTLLSVLPFPADSPRQPVLTPELAGAEDVVGSRVALLSRGFIDSVRLSFIVADRNGVIVVAGAAGVRRFFGVVP